MSTQPSVTNTNPGCIHTILELFGLVPEPLPYKKKGRLLSNTELSFYQVLKSISAGRFAICAKVRMADILTIGHTRNYYRHFNRIAQKHIDFLLCNPDTMEIIAAIELDDSSHNSGSRQDRDYFVKTALDAAQIPLIRFPARRTYNTQEIAEQIKLTLERASQPPISQTGNIARNQSG